MARLTTGRGWLVCFSRDDAARRRWSIASRVLAAIFGGYALTSLLTLALPLALGRAGFSQAQVLLVATIGSFIIYASIIMAVFSARSAKRAWVMLLAASMSIIAIILILSAIDRP